MGGKGSGRPPSTETLVKQSAPQITPIGDSIFIPNYSGIKDEAKNTDPTDLSAISLWTSGAGSLYPAEGQDISGSVLRISGSDLFAKDGEVGIGTVTPDTKLHVKGDSGLTVDSVTQGGFGGILDMVDWLDEGVQTRDDLRLSSNGGIIMNLDTNTNNTLEGDFVVTTNSSTSPHFVVKGGATDAGIGRVGIGTDAPDALLNVSSDAIGGTLLLVNTATGGEARWEMTGGGNPTSRLRLSARNDSNIETVGIDPSSTTFFNTNGNFGIATTTPQSQLEVSGSMAFSGVSGGSGLPYGSIFLSSGANVIDVVDGAYTELDGLSGSSLHRMTATSGALTAQVSGAYLANWSASMTSDGNSKIYKLNLFVNGVEHMDGSAIRKIGTGADVGNMGASGIINVNAGDTIELRVKGVTDGTNITIADANLNVVQIGGNDS